MRRGGVEACTTLRNMPSSTKKARYVNYANFQLDPIALS